MGLFSSFRKNKQEPAASDGEFYSRAEEAAKPARSRRARAETNPDAALPERKRARRRLIGALALVLAAVIGLPMILDSEPQPVSSNIAIEIPSKEKSELPSVRHTAPAYPTPGMSAEEAPQPASAETQSAPTGDASKGEAPSTTSSEKPKETTAKPQPAASAPASASEGKASVPTAKKADEARALALLDGKTTEKAGAEKSASAKTGESFVVQVAALSGKAKVADLRAKLKHAGIQSYTQSVATGSGERIRVRVGPFGSKDEAAKMLKRLSKLGLKSATIVPGGH